MKRYIAIIAALLFLMSCSKDYELVSPSLEVSAPLVVKVGQKVEFSLSGRQDILTFWSGEFGSDYSYKDVERIGEANDISLTFSTTTTAGAAGYPNPSSLPFSYSTDFSGEYTVEGMEAATWTDITSNFTWPTDTGQTVPAGTLFLDDILPKDGSPVYFRFFYHVSAYDKAANGGLGNGRTQWQVRDLSFYFSTLYGDYTLYDSMSDENWQFVFGDGCETVPSANLPVLPGTSNRILFRSQFQPETDLSMWAISGPICRPDDMNFGRDKGSGIKSLADPQMTSFYYTYESPGNYDVTFVAINANMDGSREIVRHVGIEVVQDTGNISGPVSSQW